MQDIAFKPLFSVDFETHPQIIGDVPAGYFRRAGIISGGSFKGAALSGKALPGGGDWLIRRPDGVIHLDVRAILETDDGETLYMTYTGRLKSPPDGEERLARGETLSGSEIYFRTWVQFETAAPRLLWLNDIVAVGVGQRRPQGPHYDIYELL
ncbi:MAG: DUF3237 domain-containing protein [Porticoccaceae bacterium]|nr:DUF3237 domain-containing protein [Porticoccaceae bacterium]